MSRRPVLLTRPLVLPRVTADVLGVIGASNATVVGGASAVSDATYSQIASITGGVKRVPGVDRYATAAAVARFGIEQGIVSARYVGVATGLGFADALGGGIATGAERGVLVLTRPDVLPPVTRNFIQANGAGIRWVRLYGSAHAVSSVPMRGIDALLR